MRSRSYSILTLLTLATAGNAAAQLRADVGSEWHVAAPDMGAPEAPALPIRITAPESHTLGRTVGRTLLGSAAGAAATILYFAVRDEDTYECNACVERASVAFVASSTGTAFGANAAGASGPRSVVAAVAGSAVGTLVGLALIEPLSAGWPAGMIGYTLSQGLVAGLIAHGGVR